MPALSLAQHLLMIHATQVERYAEEVGGRSRDGGKAALIAFGRAEGLEAALMAIGVPFEPIVWKHGGTAPE
jgi:hypothetical protein